MSSFARRAGLTAVLVTSLIAPLSVGTAAAAHVACGATVSTSIVLDADVGPCSAGGLVVTADNITINLNGHRLFGRAGSGDGIGILLVGRTGVTVQNGTVRDFDAGVVIDRGRANTVRYVNAFDNITTGAGANARAGHGNGIGIVSSKDNVIFGNNTVNNGPRAGIGLYSALDPLVPGGTGLISSGNRVDSNSVVGNISSTTANLVDTDNIGIRIEPLTSGNFFLNNRVVGNGLDGITLFAGASENVLRGNIVDRNGYIRVATRRGNGIGLQSLPAQGGANRNIIEYNLVTRNADNGIVARGPRGTQPGARFNTIRFNTAIGNVALPTLPSIFGPAYDLLDTNPDCDENVWQGNRYRTAFPPCAGA